METSSTSRDSANDQTPLLGGNVVGLRVYKKRWLMLTIFALNAITGGLLTVGLSPITNIVSVYYNVSQVAIEWTTSMFLLTYAFFTIFASYIVSKIGVRKTLILISVLQTISTIVHINCHQPNRYVLFLSGQIPAAIAYCFLLQLITQISADWFPITERASATAFGAFTYSFGNALAYVQVTNIVKNYDMQSELKTLFLFQLIIAVVVMLLTVLLYRERPDTPSSLVSTNDDDSHLSFFRALKVLITDRNYIFMSQSYGIYYGVGTTLTLLINPLLTSNFPIGHLKIIGWLGFTFLIISYLSTFILGLWLDRFHSYRGIAIMLNTSSLSVWLLFTLLFMETADFYALFGVYAILGLLAMPYMYIGPEHSAEISFPVPESISTAFITILGNLYSFVFMFSVGEMAERGYIKASCLTIVGLYAISSGFSVLSKTVLKRRNAGVRRVVEGP